MQLSYKASIKSFKRSALFLKRIAEITKHFLKICAKKFLHPEGKNEIRLTLF